MTVESFVGPVTEGDDKDQAVITTPYSESVFFFVRAGV